MMLSPPLALEGAADHEAFFIGDEKGFMLTLMIRLHS